jgi:type IV pilus biogenesis protein CpaD/CtpE
VTAEPGAPDRRPLPPGFPAERPQPPVIAESNDPFASLRILEAVARLERGREIRVDELVDRLNAANLDWLFERAVVVDALIALQANWMADYRSGTGIVLDEGDRGATIVVEDTSRMDPWLVGQAERLAAACRETLRAFARRDSAFGSG